MKKFLILLISIICFYSCSKDNIDLLEPNIEFTEVDTTEVDTKYTSFLPVYDKFVIVSQDVEMSENNTVSISSENNSLTFGNNIIVINELSEGNLISGIKYIFEISYLNSDFEEVENFKIQKNGNYIAIPESRIPTINIVIDESKIPYKYCKVKFSGSYTYLCQGISINKTIGDFTYNSGMLCGQIIGEYLFKINN